MSKLPCQIADCTEPHRARGWCSFHYSRWHETGDPLTPVVKPRKPKPTPCVIANCTRTARTRNWCPTHYDRWFRTGSTDLPPRPTAAERYWAKVDKSGGPDACWPWTGPRTKAGYGTFNEGTRSRLATRWGYENRIGPIPEGHGILHRCDNPPCQNDRHWFTGTQADNVADMVAKGRQPTPRIGQQIPTAKLTEHDVREIRRRYAAGGVTGVALAREFGVCVDSLRDAINGKTWKHVN